MRIWSILLIKSDLKWCIHLGKVSFCISERKDRFCLALDRERRYNFTLTISLYELLANTIIHYKEINYDADNIDNNYK